MPPFRPRLKTLQDALLVADSLALHQDLQLPARLPASGARLPRV